MSPAAIEALLAQHAGETVGAPDPSTEDSAAATDWAAHGSREPASDGASGTSSDGALAHGFESALPNPTQAPWTPEVSGKPLAYAVAVAPTPETVLTGTPAARAGATARDDSAQWAPHEENPGDDAQDDATHITIAGLFAQYGKYVAYFVGAGLISGSVVHFPLAPVRYAIIGAVGALIFAIASVISELSDRDPLRLLRVAVSSLALAVGIGMVSGSIQHFLDIPDRAALLIPLGVVLSLAAFGIRHGLRLKRTDLALIVPWLIIVVFALGFGLGKLADVANAQGGGAGHGHETGATDGRGGGAADGHAATEEGADDGHGDGAATAHGSDGEGKAAGDDGHAGDGGDAAAAEETDGAEKADAEDDDRAPDDAHAGGDAHTHGEDDTHADEDASEKASPEAASGDDEESALHAEESHGERLRLVP